MTILRPDDAPGGLQVMTKAGEWMQARPAEDSFVINIGDMMARWTNNRWVSALQRVANPPRDRMSGTERLSIGSFISRTTRLSLIAYPAVATRKDPRCISRWPQGTT
jgi:isopenicillin N synthase-like dioxygenase